MSGFYERVEKKMNPSHCLTPRERAVLRAVLAQLIPADADPGAEELGVGEFVEERLSRSPERWTLLRRGLAGLEESCRLCYGGEGFMELTRERREEVLRSLAAGDLPGPTWREVPRAELFRLLRDNAIYGYYSTPEARQSIGYPGPSQPLGYPDYDRYPGEEAGGMAKKPIGPSGRKGLQNPAQRIAPPSTTVLRPAPFVPPKERYDVLIVGAGAAGGILAQLLSQRGASVLILEAGPWWDPSLDYRNDELEMRKLNWPWPIGWEGEDPVRPISGWGVGGTTQRYLGWSPRFQVSDFQVRSCDGVAEDWPIRYHDLESYYNLVEQMIGVAGGEGSPQDPPRDSYTMPPHRFHCNARVVAEGARKLGLRPLPAPAAINSLGYGGRPPCNHCGFCAQGCMIGAKGSALATSLPAARVLGAEIRPHCFVTRIQLDYRGRCRGVVYLDPQGSERFQEADVIVLAANGIQVPRLLLCSTSSLFPHGLANRSGLVGKNLMVHLHQDLWGRFDRPIQAYRGAPLGAGAVIQDFCQTDTDARRGFVRGYSLISNFSGPLSLASSSGLWGRDLKELMRGYRYLAKIWTHGEDLPQEENAVLLDPERRDEFGLPLPRIVHRFCSNDLALLEHALRWSREILEAAGARSIYEDPVGRQRALHLMGTCRMGNDPERSVASSFGQTHDIPNLFLAGSCLFVTSAAATPTLTIQALAARTADYLWQARRSL